VTTLLFLIAGLLFSLGLWTGWTAFYVLGGIFAALMVVSFAYYVLMRGDRRERERPRGAHSAR
jgi:uncharacterized membrane protein YiaA